MKTLFLAWCAAALFGVSSAMAQSRVLPDFAEIAAQQGAAVVNISTTQRRRAAAPRLPRFDENDPFHEFFRRFMPPGPREYESTSLGSGFIVNADGYVLTNAHVVDSADEITVKLLDKREFKAEVIGADRRTDIALLKIDADQLPVVRLGDPTALKVGEWVVAIGSPFGFDNSVTAGIVSAKGRALPQENFVPFIQTDVAINPGNSGGPLFNLRGEVVGINSQIYSRTGGFMGLSFAIPIDVAMDVQGQLKAHGRVSRGRIGVVIQEVSRELAESFALKRAGGALVNAVERDGPADRAGVRAGDIIVAFNDKPVESSADLPRLVGRAKPGSRAALRVWRNGGTRDLTVTVAELQEERPAAGDAGRRAPRHGAAPNRLGLVLSDLSEARRRALRLNGGVQVDEVRGVTRGDLRPGDIIVALVAHGRMIEIHSVAQFDKALTQLHGPLTLQVRRGDASLFTTLKGEPDER